MGNRTPKQIIKEHSYLDTFDKNKWVLSDFHTLKVIGTGMSSNVLLCINKKNEKLYVLKQCPKSNVLEKKLVVNVHREKELLIEINKGSNFFPKLYNTFQDQYYIYFLQEFIRGGELLTWINSFEKFDLVLIQTLAAEIILALYDLHKKKYLLP